MRTSRTLTGLAAAGIAAAALLAPAPAGAAARRPAARPAGSCTTWQALAAPPAAPPWEGQVNSVAVDAVSPGDVWFPGMVDGYGASSVLRWDGHAVQESSPLPAAPPGALRDPLGASFDSATDGWALYSLTYDQVPRLSTSGFGTSPTIAARWDGGRWTVTPMAVSPDPQASVAAPGAVASLSPDSAWAVGEFMAGGSAGALTEHWDGTQWSLVPNPASAQQGAYLNALTAVSPADIWAVGEQYNAGGTSSTPLVEHWDGSTWSTVQVPAGSGSSRLESVSADSASDVWATGVQDVSGVGVPLVEHWDGSTWSVAAGLPDVGTTGGLADSPGVYAASPDDVWVTFQPEPSGAPGSFLHWDGSTWTTVPVPGPMEYGATYYLGPISGTSPGDIWAIGFIVESRDTGAVGSIAEQIYHLSCG